MLSLTFHLISHALRVLSQHRLAKISQYENQYSVPTHSHSPGRRTMPTVPSPDPSPSPSLVLIGSRPPDPLPVSLGAVRAPSGPHRTAPRCPGGVAHCLTGVSTAFVSERRPSVQPQVSPMWCTTVIVGSTALKEKSTQGRRALVFTAQIVITHHVIVNAHHQNRQN